jgi:hypothetical protein
MKVVFVGAGETKEESFAKSGVEECGNIIYVCFVSAKTGPGG